MLVDGELAAFLDRGAPEPARRSRRSRRRPLGSTHSSICSTRDGRLRRSSSADRWRRQRTDSPFADRLRAAGFTDGYRGLTLRAPEAPNDPRVGAPGPAELGRLTGGRAGPWFAIATPHDAATQAGAVAFERGGNAVDAALAAAITLAVSYPHIAASAATCSRWCSGPTDRRSRSTRAGGLPRRRRDAPVPRSAVDARLRPTLRHRPRCRVRLGCAASSRRRLPFARAFDDAIRSRRATGSRSPVPRREPGVERRAPALRPRHLGGLLPPRSTAHRGRLPRPDRTRWHARGNRDGRPAGSLRRLGRRTADRGPTRGRLPDDRR